MEYNEKLKKEYNELIEVQKMIEDEKFTKHFIEPLSKKIKKLKYAYDCKDLNELIEIRGQRKGLKQIENLINGIKQRIITIKDEIDRYDEGE